MREFLFQKYPDAYIENIVFNLDLCCCAIEQAFEQSKHYKDGLLEDYFYYVPLKRVLHALYSIPISAWKHIKIDTRLSKDSWYLQTFYDTEEGLKSVIIYSEGA
jgi:hypothetical protein